jgi:hypothetical protein
VSDPIARLLAVLSLLINLASLARKLPTVTLETVVRGPLTTDRLIIGAGGRLQMEGNLTSQASELRGMVKPDFGDVQQGSSYVSGNYLRNLPTCPADTACISGKWSDYYKGTEK